MAFPEDLARRRKADRPVAKIAWRPRQGTAMTLKWVAQRVKVGAWTHVSNCLVRKHKADEKA